MTKKELIHKNKVAYAKYYFMKHGKPSHGMDLDHIDDSIWLGYLRRKTLNRKKLIEKNKVAYAKYYFNSHGGEATDVKLDSIDDEIWLNFFKGLTRNEDGEILFN